MFIAINYQHCSVFIDINFHEFIYLVLTYKEERAILRTQECVCECLRNGVIRVNSISHLISYHDTSHISVHFVDNLVHALYMEFTSCVDCNTISTQNKQYMTVANAASYSGCHVKFSGMFY